MVRMAKRMLRVLLAILVMIIFITPVIEFYLYADYKNPDVAKTEVLNIPYSVYQNGREIKKDKHSLFFSFGRDYSLRFTLPEIEPGGEIAFVTRLTGLRFSVGEEEVYSYLYPDGRDYPFKRIIHRIKLDPSYSNQEVTVDFDPSSKFLAFVVDGPYIGSSIANYNHFYVKYRALSLVICALAIVAQFSAIFSLFVKKEHKMKIFLFSLFSLVTLLYNFLSLPYADLYINNTYLSSTTSVFLKSLVPLFYYLVLSKAFPRESAFKLRCP